MHPGDVPADSAGQPWAGRSFEPNAFSHDDGSAPAELTAVLTDFHAGRGDQARVVDAFRSARLLIPLVAHAGETETGVDGLVIDKTQELSIVTVIGPDGRRVLPVFTSVTAMSRWRSDARPVPADGVRVALAAADDSTDVVVLDPTGSNEFAFRRPMLWAIAQNKPWVAPWEDPGVRDAFRESVADEVAVSSLELVSGDPAARLAHAEVVIRLALVPGLDQESISVILDRLSTRWSRNSVIVNSIDSMTVRLLTATSAGA